MPLLFGNMNSIEDSPFLFQRLNLLSKIDGGYDGHSKAIQTSIFNFETF